MAFSSTVSNNSPRETSVSPPDKWRLASQIQKAIRHGRPDAASWAVDQLALIDPSYLRYRLSVIAVEDVGAAQVEQVVDAFSEGWTKKAIESRGGTDFLREFAVSSANGIKDRLPCDWMACTRWLPLFEEEFGSWSKLPTAKAVEMAFDRDLSWWARGLAAWRAAGTERFSNDFLAVVPGDWEAWKSACSEFAHDPLVGCVMTAGQHQREAHPVFLGLAIAERKLGPSEVVRDALPNLPDIGPWLSAAFDKHTSDGKKAYKSWLATHQEARVWLFGRGLDADAQLDAVGRLAFWLEGGQCDQHWTHAVARSVLVDTKRHFLQSRDMNPKMFAQLCVDPAGWHQARQRVVEGPLPNQGRNASWRG